MKPKEYRKRIEELICEENLLLPNFQREFVWKPQEQQLQLACSLFLDIPIGSILVLDQLDNIGTRRLCYKTENEESQSKDSNLLMDGQQRISTIKSIFSDLYSGSSDWKKIHDCLHNNLRYRWFLDLSLEHVEDNKLKEKLDLLYDFYWNKKFEDYDIEEIESFIINKKILITKKIQDRWHPAQTVDKVRHYCDEENLLPLFMILSDVPNLKFIIQRISGKYIDFLTQNKNIEFVKQHITRIKEDCKIIIENKEKRSEIINQIETNVTKFFDNHVIHKDIYGVEYKKTQLNKAIVAFNTMNTGGISLGVFDIVSAKYSKLKKGRLFETLFKHAEHIIKNIDDSSVEELIKDKFIEDDKNIITKNFSDMYLNMLSLFKNSDEPCSEFKLDLIKQKSLLKINEKDIEEHSEKSVRSLILAFQFLIKRCGISSIKDIKYQLTAIPIAYNLYQNTNKNEMKEIEDKIEYSYWMSLFSGKYEKGQNAFSIDHLKKLTDFIKKSENDPFKQYQNDLCNKKGYSDLEGFKAFYEDNSYSYNSNIGEYFLQFILSSALKKETEIFKKHANNKEAQIKIEHFKNLDKDHIIPSSWIASSEKKSSVHSVLNKFYSPSQINRKRLNNPIREGITQEGLKILCIDTQLNYSREEFNSEDKIKQSFLQKRFNLFKESVKQHLKDLEKTWKT